ncbi:hypothetical protein, partial [Amycolatopsis echigonensis]
MTTKIGAVTERRYAQLVRQGCSLVVQKTHAQFRLGDNALEIEPMWTAPAKLEAGLVGSGRCAG